MARSTRTAAPFALLCSSVLFAAACSSGASRGPAWPELEVLPERAPAGLDLSAERPTLRRGPAGFLYVVGLKPGEAKPGDHLVARYAGEWPLGDLPRPPMAAGRITRVVEGAALVQLWYAFPEVDPDGLIATFGEDQGDVGKGLGRVASLQGEPDRPEAVRLALGKNVGVQAGDMFAVIADPDRAGAPASELQLGRRLRSVCLVNEVDDAEASCRLWQPSALHPSSGAPAPGDAVIFLEHAFGLAPRTARVQFAPIEGDSSGEVRAHLMEQFDQYLRTHAAASVIVEPIEAALDPRSETLYRADESIAYTGGPQIAVAAALVERDGEARVVVNYTGVGPASGPGMVAAPPEGGIDLGEADAIDGTDLRHLFGTLYAAALVYRGQTSEALMHLRSLLEDERLRGPLRWHNRDQYAMRWAALGRADEALWLVMQDEAIARRAGDRRAELNALGTRVRLHEMAEAPEAALAAAERYFEARSAADDPRSPGALGALGMLAEMRMAAGQVERAEAALDQASAACPDGCDGDLFSVYASVFWEVPRERAALQDAIVERMAALAAEAKSPERTATLRLFQGHLSMREGLYEQALIAFLEAKRLFEERDSGPGRLHAIYFEFLAHLAMREPIRAYEMAREGLETARVLRDYAAAARIYERLPGVYLGLDLSQAPGSFMKLASGMLVSVYESQIATGDLSSASETLLAIGSLFFRMGSADEAENVLQRSVVYAIRSVRFDVAARGHLVLGFIARARGDAPGFRDELERARLMARLSSDPELIESIERALDPSEDEDDDTKLL